MGFNIYFIAAGCILLAYGIYGALYFPENDSDHGDDRHKTGEGCKENGEADAK